MREPLDQAAAKQLILTCVDDGTVDISPHAWKEMENDGMTVVDVFQVLKGGVVEPAEFENGSWRYRVRQDERYVVVAFRSETRTVVVTVWRK